MQSELRTKNQLGPLMGAPLLAMLTVLSGHSLANGPPAAGFAPSCIDFEVMMRAGKVPSVRLNTSVWTGSNSVRPRELVAVNTGSTLDFPSMPAVYMLAVPAKVGTIRDALMQGGYIVNGVADPYNAIPASTLIPLAQKGGGTPVNVEMLYCGWVVSTIALADTLRPLDLPEALWQFKAILAGSSGRNEPVEAQEFRASVPKRLSEQAQRLAAGALSGSNDPKQQLSLDQSSRGRASGPQTATAVGKGEAMPAEFMAGNSKVLGQFVRDPGGVTYSGTGRISFANGDIYNGTIEMGKREGNGKFVWANGQRFEGEWRRDRPNGQGAMWFTNGDHYEGAIEDGVPNGTGRMKYGSGDRYEGQFRSGAAHGRGAYTWVSGQRMDGDWVEGQSIGNSNMRFANGDIYDGAVSGGSPNGRGRMIYAAGDMYVGNFRNGLPDGEGTFMWKRGDQYKGQWKGGVKEGPGVMTWENGERWQGIYRNDQQMEGTTVRNPS